MRILLSVVFVLLSVVEICGQTLKMSVHEPIPISASDELTCLFFDHNGMMFIGTGTGLKSYDGYKQSYIRSNIGNSDILPDNHVTCITEDKKHRLWVGTMNGLVRIDSRTGMTEKYILNNDDKKVIYALFTSSDGTVWIGTDAGLCFYDEKKNKFVLCGEQNTWVKEYGKKKRKIGGSYAVKSIVEDKHGNIYVGTWGHGLLKFNRKEHTMYGYQQINERNIAFSLFLDNKERLWIGTWRFGLIRMDNPGNPENPQIYNYYHNEPWFDNYYRMTEDTITNTLWACSRDGVSIVDLNEPNKQPSNYTMAGEKEKVSLGFGIDIAKDRNGKIWIATIYDGLIQINAERNLFQNWKISVNDMPMKINSVSALYTDNGKDIWIGTRPFGLASYNKQTKDARFVQNMPMFTGVPSLSKTSTFTSIERRYNGEIWFADNFYGVVVIKPDKTTQLRDENFYPFMKDHHVKTIFQDRNNVMWLGCGSNITIVYPNEKGLVLNVKDKDRNLSNIDVTHITDDSKGNVWISTRNDGIIKVTGSIFKPEKLKFHIYSKGDVQRNYNLTSVTACFEDSRQRLWAISMNDGLFKYDEEKDAFISVRDLYNIACAKVYAINEDEFGNLWLACDNSLKRLFIDDKDNATLASYNSYDGIGDILFQPNATFKYGNELMFGTKEGFFSFYPSEILKNTEKETSSLLVTEIYFNDQAWEDLEGKVKEEVSKLAPSYTKELTIPSDIEKFAVEYAILSYGNQDKCRYSYKLTGYDDEWHYQDADRHIASFQNLPAGTYYLEIKASDHNGKWIGLGYNIKIRILPPWYKSWWAYSLYLILFTVMLFIGIVAYRRHLDTENKLKMAEIFTNIIHELLTPLTTVSAALDDIKEKVPQYASSYFMAQNNINRVTLLLRQMLYENKFIEYKIGRDSIVKLFNTENSVENSAKDQSKPSTAGSSVLIVEDDKELLEVMGNIVGRHYNVFKSKNGEQAMKIVWKEKLDIVVSEVMLPMMNGIELTRNLKSNSDYAQLPVLLLTSKISEKDKKDALAAGADECMTKPFEMEDLILRIDNLIRNRRIVHTRILKQLSLKVETKHTSDPDANFILNATECVIKHLADANYDRDSFARDMFVSPSTLYNKLRSITGKNVSAFMNHIRLREACRILEAEPNITINELALRVGFNTPKYFSKCFKKEFGVGVKDYTFKQ